MEDNLMKEMKAFAAKVRAERRQKTPVITPNEAVIKRCEALTDVFEEYRSKHGGEIKLEIETHEIVDDVDFVLTYETPNDIVFDKETMRRIADLVDDESSTSAYHTTDDTMQIVIALRNPFWVSYE